MGPRLSQCLAARASADRLRQDVEALQAQNQVLLRQQQANERSNQKLRALREPMLGVVCATHDVTVKDRKRFRMSAEEIATASIRELEQAVAEAGFETAGARNDEMRVMAALASQLHVEGGTLAEWCWQEEMNRVSQHDPATVRPPRWIMYAEIVAVQLEAEFRRWKAGESEDPSVSVDVNGRVKSTSNGGKAFAAETGGLYSVDLKRMVQINAKTEFERPVCRMEIQPGVGEVANTSSRPTATVSTDLVLEAAGDNEASSLSFPRELADAGETVLLVKKGMLVQVQRKRADGWWYGYRLPGPEDVEEGPRTCSWRGGDDEDDWDSGAGWLPAAFTSPADAEQILPLQLLLGGKDRSRDCLAPPEHWLQTGASETAGRQVPLPTAPGCAEREKVETAFRRTMGSNVRIERIDRVENVSMWQSYAVKRQTLILREDKRREIGKGAVNAKEAERAWLFHGTTPNTVSKIVSLGFNRSFCGKNNTCFGKGVYFARDASYSARSTYSPADDAGVKYMFLCRVAIGAFCKGDPNAVVPSARDGDLPYDCTVNDVQDPTIFVTYHDAQAYPEYLVAFRM